MNKINKNKRMFWPLAKSVFMGLYPILLKIAVILFTLLVLLTAHLGGQVYELIIPFVITLFICFMLMVLFDPRFSPFIRIQEPIPFPKNIRNKFPKTVLISTDNAATASIGKILFAEPDDALALAILIHAHRKGEITIAGIVSTFGNTSGDMAYAITRKQVGFSEVDIPVIEGASVAGQTDSEAVQFIANTLRRSSEKIVLVALGPVTDYAAVFQQYPELKEKVEYFFCVRSGPYLYKRKWYLFSYNAYPDISSATFMYQLGANQFQMGEEMFAVSLSNRDIDMLQDLKDPMFTFITRDLKKWNFQNKFFPVRGYLKRKGNMCPRDAIWIMYLVEPDLFELIHAKNSFVLKIKDLKKFKIRMMARLTSH